MLIKVNSTDLLKMLRQIPNNFSLSPFLVPPIQVIYFTYQKSIELIYNYLKGSFP